MPVIEYIHSLKIYRVSIAKTVEWGQFLPFPRPEDPYAPFVGVNRDGAPDICNSWDFPVAQQKEAFTKMVELWDMWKRDVLPNPVHC